MKRLVSMMLMVIMITTTLASCGSENSKDSSNNKSNASDHKSKDNVEDMTYALREAPILKEKVQSGDLPELKDRIPVQEDIKVVEVVDSIGVYGGDWNNYFKGSADKWIPGYTTEEPLFKFNKEGTGVEPNVAKSVSVNENSTEFVIELREGMKWSDGMPFTADDVLFYWHHMLIPETFGKKLYNCYYSVDPETGEKSRAVVEKIDDYKFKVTHKYPSPLFLERLAIDNKWFFAPAHYYKQILPEFVGEARASAIAKERGFSDIKDLGKWTGYYYWVWPDRPTLRAWVASNDIDGERFVMTRNAYYWKTDEVGQQLPYLDRIIYNRVEDESHYVLEAMAGNIDMREMNISDFTVLKENESVGKYKINLWNSPQWSEYKIQLNQTVEDPNLRKLFNDIRFREALSIAVDRKEIVEIVTAGIAEPQQASVTKGLPNYIEGWGQKWTEYDVEKAKKLLDEIGLKWDAKGEYRTFADGSELNLNLFRESNGKQGNEKYAALLKKYYEAIGLQTNIKALDRSLLFDMKLNNKLDARIDGNIGVVNVAYRPDVLVPLRVVNTWYGHYGRYTATGGESGVQPEGDVAKVIENWNKVVSSTNQEDVAKWSNEIIKLHEKNQWIIGYTSPTPFPILVKENFKNVPKDAIFCDEFRFEGHARPEQFYKTK